MKRLWGFFTVPGIHSKTSLCTHILAEGWVAHDPVQGLQWVGLLYEVLYALAKPLAHCFDLTRLLSVLSTATHVAIAKSTLSLNTLAWKWSASIWF